MESVTAISEKLAPRPNHDTRFTSQIVRGDVLVILSQCQWKFDVVIADPPYNIGKDFGNNNDHMPLSEYVEWSEKWIKHCLDLLTRNGLVYVYGFPEILAHIATRYPVDHQRWLIWHYTNKVVPSSRFWQRSHEVILCLWNEGAPRPGLEIDQIREPYSRNYLRAAGRTRAATNSRFSNGHERTTTYIAHEKGALPRDVLRVPALAGGAGANERWFMCLDHDRKVLPPSALREHRNCKILKHPTQKPLALTQRLLLSRINGNGGRTLIPFAGSGSECVAAQGLGIDYLGVEINPDYVEFAEKWLSNVRTDIQNGTAVGEPFNTVP